LARPIDQHLTQNELEALASSSAVREGKLASAEEHERDLRSHVAECETCRSLVTDHLTAQERLASLKAGFDVPRTAECPPEEVWLSVVGGLLGTDEAQKQTRHAASCDHCGPLLRQASQDFRDDSSPEEKVVLERLKSRTPEWQGHLAAELADTTGRRAKEVTKRGSWWRSQFVIRRLAFVGAGLALVFVTVWTVIEVSHPKSVEQLLAEAYSERRTLEIRVPGASHAEVWVGRGPGSSNLDRPSSLLKAEAMISEQLSKSPEDPRWLQAKARADLLDGNYPSAIKSLRHALTENPDSSSLLGDLGAVYYQEAISDRAHHSDDFGKAYELLSTALAKSPDDPVLLFNRAIVAENASLFVQAEEDWQHYLQIDPKGPWSSEARRRVELLRQRNQKWKQNRLRPLLTPEELGSRQSGEESLQERVNPRIEEYLRSAVAVWLPRSFPSEPQSGPNADMRAAMRVLSEITLRRHHDSWLKELLEKSDGKRFPLAVNALSQALAANGRGDYDEAERQSIDAERWFSQEFNLAGALRARYEHLFALQFIRNGAKCASLASQAVQSALRTRYSWLQTQLLLEESACLNINAEIGQSRRRFDQALQVCNANDYQDSCLRCITFASDDSAAAGDLRTTWARALQGLNLFWAGDYPELRGYSLYDPVITAAEVGSQPFVQVAAWKQATSLIDSDNDLLQRALAHFYFAQAAMDANLLATFDKEYQEYNRLFEAAPKGLAWQSDRTEIELITAKLEAKRGNSARARTRLETLLPEIQKSGNTYRTADVFATLGELEQQAGARTEAEQHLSSGLAVTEEILRTLRTEKERIEWEQKASSVYRALVEDELQRGDKVRALEIWEWYLGAAIRRPVASSVVFFGTKEVRNESGVDIRELNAVRSSLPSLTNRTVLAYAFLVDGLAIWAYDNRGITVAFVRRNPKEIELLAKRFAELCAEPDSDTAALRKNGAALFGALIVPIESSLERGRELVIESDGVLSTVPFEALVDSSSHYIAENWTVVSSLGLDYEMALRPTEKISGSDRALAVAVAAPSGFSPLPGLQTEVETVAGHYSRSTILKDNQATLSAVTEALRSASIFYFAGHALGTPERVGLVMADIDPKTQRPRLLTAEDLKPENVRKLKIAILAGCDTAKGESGSYNDVTSLARALVRGGVPMVVVSRWELSSGAPERLNLPFVFPQRPARTDIHPFYWASLNQFGRVDFETQRR
jgi:CHAT domain-containing protein